MSQPSQGGPVDKTPATLSFKPAELAGVADTHTFARDTSAPDKKATQPAVAGQQFGDYELLEEIARGGMGVVYKARQRGLKRLVALKTIQAGEFANADQILRFQAEAQSVARLNHPGIVPVYEVGIYRGLHFFSMQYLVGGSLADRLKDGPLQPRDGATIVRQVAEAVQAAHEQQIIHRDLKPGNILLDEQGVPRVTDFGLAKQLDSDDGLTQTGDVMGTPSYMAPEQAQGSLDAIGTATDVYALGAILYHVLTGRPPFQGASKIETLRQVVEQEPVPPRQLSAAIPCDLETIALKCLRKDPDKRYETAAELAADVGRWLENKPIVARPVGRGEKAWLWCKRRPAVAAAIAVTTVAIVGSGLAISVIQRAGAERQAETVVASYLIAPAAAVPYTLAQLKALRHDVKPLLRAKLADESADAVERLHAATGLTELGEPQQFFLLEAIPNAQGAECPNIVAALQGVKSTALPEVGKRSAMATEPLVKVRYAIVALHLGDPLPAQELLALRADPIDRTTLIHSFADWHGDLAVVAVLLSQHNDAAFRSGLCAALGTISWESIPSAERDAVRSALFELYTQAPDGGTHSAAGWALRQWNQDLPFIAASKQPAEGRQWHLNGQGTTMLTIPFGKFTMGMPGGKAYRGESLYEVTIARAFMLADREVTVGQFLRFLEDADYPAAEKPSGWKQQYKNNIAFGPSADGPVHSVNWFDAVLYCNWLSGKEGLQPAYVRTGDKWTARGYQNRVQQESDAWRCEASKDGYRLPAEVEWEYACRATTTSAYCFGDDDDQMMRYGWIVNNSNIQSWPGGLKLPNNWGLFDIHGNLWEWCEDLSKPGNASKDNDSRVARGGAFAHAASDCSSAYRGGGEPHFRNYYFGFRLARTYPLKADEAALAVGHTGSADSTGPPGPRARPLVETRASDPPVVPSADEQVQRWVEDQGGQVEKSNGMVTSVQIVEGTIADADLARLSALSKLRYLNLGRTPITDAGIAHLRGAKKLESLLIADTQVTGPGLAGLVKLPSLHILSLGGPLINDDSLSHLPALPLLRNLLLTDTKVSDAGLMHLLSLPELRVLNLSGSSITDAGIEQLSGLAGGRLEKLYLKGTGVTPAGVARLRIALPKCEIDFPE